MYKNNETERKSLPWETRETITTAASPKCHSLVKEGKDIPFRPFRHVISRSRRMHRRMYKSIVFLGIAHTHTIVTLRLRQGQGHQLPAGSSHNTWGPRVPPHSPTPHTANYHIILEEEPDLRHLSWMARYHNHRHRTIIIAKREVSLIAVQLWQNKKDFEQNNKKWSEIHEYHARYFAALRREEIWTSS